MVRTLCYAHAVLSSAWQTPSQQAQNVVSHTSTVTSEPHILLPNSALPRASPTCFRATRLSVSKPNLLPAAACRHLASCLSRQQGTAKPSQSQHDLRPMQPALQQLLPQQRSSRLLLLLLRAACCCCWP
jgi:hypothetical protein